MARNELRRRLTVLSFVPAMALASLSMAAAHPASMGSPGEPAESAESAEILILGVAQDGGVPQAGSPRPQWMAPGDRLWAASLAVVFPRSEQRFVFDATPDFREQLALLDATFPTQRPAPGLDGIFLTHAHIGHYVGLMHLGHEAMGARGVPVWAMPRMAKYLRSDGPWSQLVDYGNITLKPLVQGEASHPTDGLQVTPLRVPHREEFSEAVGFRFESARKSALFIPDIDSWKTWAEQGVEIADLVRSVDYAFLDGTFYADGEIPGRDMSGFPHPRITWTMERLGTLPAHERAKVYFIHLNHTNPALDPAGSERRAIEEAGFRVVAVGDRFPF